MACERSAAEGGAVQARRIHCPCRVGRGAHLQLGSAQPTCPVDPATDAAAQRHRGVEHHEKDGLAAMPPTRPLTFVTVFASWWIYVSIPVQELIRRMPANMSLDGSRLDLSARIRSSLYREKRPLTLADYSFKNENPWFRFIQGIRVISANSSCSDQVDLFDFLKMVETRGYVSLSSDGSI